MGILARPLYFTLGFISLLLGLIGILLPVLPTTPFILLAAFGFSRSSKRFHQRLLSNRWFGPMIVQWEAHGTIPLKIKCFSTTLMLVMISYPILYRELPLWLDMSILALVAVGVAYVWSRPSVPRATTAVNASSSALTKPAATTIPEQRRGSQHLPQGDTGNKCTH